MISFGQQQNANWYFGNGAGLNFDTNTTTLSDGQTTNANNYTASISDEDGELLFYTDGNSVWNTNHQIISSGLNGASRTVSIVPKPGDCDKYYIFTVNNDYFYSIVDFNTNALGEVTETNQPLNILPHIATNGVTKTINERPNHMAVAKHADNESYWLILNPFDEFFSVLIDSSGIHPNSNTFSELPPNTGTTYGNGYTGISGIAVSEQMDRLAYGNYWENFNPLFGYIAKRYEWNILEFDNASGEIEFSGMGGVNNNWPDTGTIYAPFRSFEFSQNGNFLYGLVVDDELSSYVQQIDLNSQIFTNQINVGISGQLENNVKMARGLDGRIYIPNGGNNLTTIINPNLGNTTLNQLNLGAGNTARKLPQLVQIQDLNNDCNIEPCEGISLEISNANTFPECDELNGIWSFPVELTLFPPTGYGNDEVFDDFDTYGVNFITLNITNTDNNTNFATLPADHITSFQVNANGSITFIYAITNSVMFPALETGNYAFDATYQLTTSDGTLCPVNSETVEGISFDDCETDPCEILALTLASPIPTCQEVIESPSSEICFDYVIPNGYVPTQIMLTFNGIDLNPDNFTIIENNVPISGQDNLGNTYGSFCFTFDQTFFASPYQGDYLISASINTENSASEACNGKMTQSPIFSFDDCDVATVGLDPITLDCEELGTNFEFEICGSYSESENEGHFLAALDLEIIDIDTNTPYTVISATQANFTSLTEYCFQVTQDNFPSPLEGNYNFRIRATFFVQDTGEMFDLTDTIQGVNFIPCEVECEPIRRFTITDGRLLEWDGNAGNYTLYIQSDRSCCESNDRPSGPIQAYEVNGNQFDLEQVRERYGECLRFRIDSECDRTSWCCLVFDRDRGWQLPRDCFRETVTIGIGFGRINVYPNPATNKISVSTEDSKIASVELYNIYGKPVQTIKNINTLKQDIDVNRFSRGYYVLKVTLDDGSVQHKNVILK